MAAGRDGPKTFSYAKPTSMTHGDIVTMWHMVDFNKPQSMPGKSQFLSLQIREEFNCRDRVSRKLGYYVDHGNMAKGGEVDRDTNPNKWEPVAPKSLVEILWKHACEDL